MNIATRVTAARGCGFRKPGGLYLVAGAPSAPCGKLPLELTVCPCCGRGIKFCRGWTWVDADQLFAGMPCGAPRALCTGCPMGSGKMGKAGLLWVGKAFYATPQHFAQEAAQQGISRRIKTVPKGFELGSTWVLFAHLDVIMREPPVVPVRKWFPAVFMACRPTAVEYVVKGTESDQQLERMVARGITPVRDVKPEEQTNLLPE